jgi:hypothetical protein
MMIVEKNNVKCSGMSSETFASDDDDEPPKPPMPRIKLANWLTNTTSPAAFLVVTKANRTFSNTNPIPSYFRI